MFERGSRQYLRLAIAFAMVIGCAKAKEGGGPSDAPMGPDGPAPDASCGDHCDKDGDGVFDNMDKCPNTPPGAMVNHDGCADSQLTPMLENTFPPYNLVWTNGGNLGRAGGLNWGYTGIQRGDLFHIYWIICDDPATPCGVSLDGPIDAAGENWLYDAANSNVAMGKLVFANTTGIKLADNTTRPLTGRLTINVVDSQQVALPFQTVSMLGVTGRAGSYGVEIPGNAFDITAIIEVKDAASAFTPYLDYYDAAPTPPAGGGTSVSFGGSFYDK